MEPKYQPGDARRNPHYKRTHGRDQRAARRARRRLLFVSKPLAFIQYKDGNTSDPVLSPYPGAQARRAGAVEGNRYAPGPAPFILQLEARE